MKLKKAMLLLLLMVLFSSFSLTVEAKEEIEKNSLDETILNEESADAKFVSGSVIVRGNLSDNLTVDDFLDNKISVDESFFEKYDIDSICVKNGEELKQATDIVINGMMLVFETNDATTYEYEIKVVGDLNNDGIVNNDDMNILADGILKDEDVSVVNDINGDGVCDVLDVTNILYSIDNKDWNVGNVDDIENIDLVSELDSLDEVYVGDSLEVTYKIKGYDVSKFKGISGVLNYDKNLLELDSIFVDSDYGKLNDKGKFLYVISEEVDEIVITISFNVIAKGNTTVSITDVLSSIDGVKTLEKTLDVSKDIDILEYGIGGDDEEEVSSSDTDTNTNTNTNVSTQVVATSSVVPVRFNEGYYVSNIVATKIVLSSDNYIKSLKIKNYKIDFDKYTLEYSLDVGNKVNSLELDVVLNDDKANYEVIGNGNFRVGKNVVTIKVTAEDGSIRNYVINVNKKKASISEEKSNDSNTSKTVIIILIILIIFGLIYVIFKDDEENKDSKE